MNAPKLGPIVAGTLSLVLLGMVVARPDTVNVFDQQQVGGPSAQECTLENNSYGTEAAAIEYARLIEPELGVPPSVDCGTHVELPIYVNGVQAIGNPGLHGCDNPSLQVGDCMSGSGLQRYEGRGADGTPMPNVVWVSFCRHDGRDTDEYDIPDSVQLIGYNTETGATAFFESGDNAKWTYVEDGTNRLMGMMPGIEDPAGFNEAYRTPGTVQCVSCHQADPFIHNPFIDAAKLPNDTLPVVPRISGREVPYYIIGGSDWDMRTIHIEGNGCLRCHRIGMKTLEEFMGDGWHPNDHMPPRDPGSLAADFDELLQCWRDGPENTPGCEWVIPPAGTCAGQVVGEEYPYKAAFNRPRLP